MQSPLCTARACTSTNHTPLPSSLLKDVSDEARRLLASALLDAVSRIVGLGYAWKARGGRLAKRDKV